jgi:hypothetical protein
MQLYIKLYNQQGYETMVFKASVKRRLGDA